MLSLLLLMISSHTVNAALSDVLLLADPDQGGIFTMNISTQGPRTRILIPGLQRPLAVGYDPGEDIIFFSGNHEKGYTVIGRVSPKGHHLKFRNLPQISAPFTVAPDFVSKVVYYADEAEHAIGIFSYDLSFNKLIITGQESPAGVVLHPSKGKLYFASHNENDGDAYIKEAHMDGTNLKVLHTMRQSAYIIDMALDQTAGVLYFVADNIMGSSVFTFHLGTLIRTSLLNIDLATSRRYSYLTLALDGHSMYIAQYDNKTLLRYLKDVSFGQVFGTVPTWNSTIYDMVAVTSAGMASVSTSCSINNGGCQMFCLPTPTGRTCDCGEGYLLQQDNSCKQVLFRNVVLFTDYSRGGIFIYDIDANSTKRVGIYAVHSPTGVDYADGYVYVANQRFENLLRGCLNRTCTTKVADLGSNSGTPTTQLEDLDMDATTGNIYIVDSYRKVILQVNNATSFTQVVVSTDLGEPKGLSLDPIQRLIFFTDIGPSPKIERASMDKGVNRRILVASDIRRPTDVVTDISMQEIYWCDQVMMRIEKIRYDGTGRQVVVSESAHYLSLAIDKNYIYFSKTNSRYLHRVDRRTGRSPESLGEGSFPGISNMVLVNLGPTVSNTTDDTGLLIVLDQYNGALYTLGLDGSGLTKLPTRSLNNPKSCSYDPRTEQVFLTEAGTASSIKYISRVSTDGSARFRTQLPGRSKPSGLSLDFISNLVYYSDAGENLVGVYSMDFRYHKVLIDNINGVLGDIALDFYEGKIFITRLSPPTIMSADANGQNVKDIINTDLSSPYWIVVDPKEKMIYWSDNIQLRIERSSYTGTGRTLLALGQHTGHKYRAITVDDMYIYFSHEADSQLFRMPKTGGTPTRFGPLSSDLEVIGDIDVYKPSLFTLGTNACSRSNGNCTQLCLSAPGGRTCACDTQYTMSDADRGTCVKSPYDEVLLMTDRIRSGIFVMDIHTGSRYRLPIYNLNGVVGLGWDPKERQFYWTDAQYNILSLGCIDSQCLKTVVDWTVEQHLEDLAVDYVNGNVYVVDSQNKRILEVSVDSGESQTVITLGISKPRAMSIDIRNRFLYWTDIGPRPKIQRASMGNWSNLENIITRNLSSPSDIAIDQENGMLYWCDGTKKVIEKSSLDGSNRITLFTERRVYLSITIDSTYLYFFELHGSGVIFRISKENGLGLTSIGGSGLQKIYGMVYINLREQYSAPTPDGNGISGEETGMKTMLIIYISAGVGGAVLLTIIIAVTTICCCLRKKRKRQTVPNSTLEQNIQHQGEGNTYERLNPKHREAVLDNLPYEQAVTQVSVPANQTAGTPQEQDNQAFQSLQQQQGEQNEEKDETGDQLMELQTPQFEFVRGSKKRKDGSTGFGSSTEEILWEKSSDTYDYVNGIHEYINGTTDHENTQGILPPT